MQCPKCGSEAKLIPEGISKRTGKPYQAFYSCGNCKNTWNASADAQSPQPTQPSANTGNVERILEAIKGMKTEILEAINKLG